MRRTALLICCAVGLVVAGCSGPSDTATELSPTPAEPPTIPETTSDDPLAGVTVVSVTPDTPAPEPTPTARPDATFQGVAMPPGTDERGIVNEQRLARAIDESLDSTAFRLVENRTERSWNNDTLQSRTNVNGTAVLTPDGSFRAHYQSIVIEGDSVNLNVTGGSFSRGETVYRRLVRDGETEYRARDYDPEQLKMNLAQDLVSHLAGNWEPTATTTVNGRIAVVFEPSPSKPGDGRLVVDDRGFVHELRFQRESQWRDGAEVEVTSYTLEPKSNGTLEEPSWFDEAKNATSGNDTTPSTVTTVPG